MTTRKSDARTRWHDEYQRKLVTPAEAVRVVKSGDKVEVPVSGEAVSLALALVARADELEDVDIYIGTPTQDVGWYDEWATAFTIKMGFIPRFTAPVIRNGIEQRRFDLHVRPSSLHVKGASEAWRQERRTDVCFIKISPPDANGYCSFGNGVWEQPKQAATAKVVLAEVNPSMIRTFGANHIHVSDIDYFVEAAPEHRRIGYVVPPDPPPHAPIVAGHLASLIHDGDTIQMGVGPLVESMVSAGAFRDKNDLGWHTERTPRGGVRLIRDGIFTGENKNIHTGKVVATCIPLEQGDEEFVHLNPMFELYDISYTNNIRTIASNDNMVAILGCLAVDLTGQVTSESIDGRPYAGAGGQPEFAIGSVTSKGGRSIFLMNATTAGETVSRIVPTFAPGTVVTVPRIFVDHVITEYGIARLFGKTQRERAQALIDIAHPAMRADLQRAAEQQFWPATRENT